MKVHSDMGTRIYTNAAEVIQELARRGVAEKTTTATAAAKTGTADVLSISIDWQRKEGPISSSTSEGKATKVPKTARLIRDR